MGTAGLPLVTALAALALATMDPRPARAQREFNCTEVIGFSQSMEWFGAFSLAERREAGGRPSLSGEDFLPGWQGRFQFGAAVELWRDPVYAGWQGMHASPTMCGHGEVDRIVFNVSGAARAAEEWAADAESVVRLLREKYSAATRIVLIAVVGSTEVCPDVRAAQNHPTIVRGLEIAALNAGDDVVAEPAPKVDRCVDYSDRLGHLTGEGARQVHEALAAHFTR